MLSLLVVVPVVRWNRKFVVFVVFIYFLFGGSFRLYVTLGCFVIGCVLVSLCLQVFIFLSCGVRFCFFGLWCVVSALQNKVP